MKNVPMSFFPLRASKTMSRPFRGISEIVQTAFPRYNLVLAQSELYLDSDEFFSIVILNTIIWWFLVSGFVLILFNLLRINNAFVNAPIVGLILAVLIFFRIVLGVQLEINKKVKSIDSNLVFGLKMILVEINAGVGLFDSIVMVASYKLGDLSNVFKEIAKRLNAGEKEEDVLKDVATKNPSPFLKKVLWQIVSGLKVGSPLAKVIQESLNGLERQQSSDVVEYGSTLRVFTLIFMMLGVIIPAMGVSFIVVINSMPGISIGKELPWVFIILVAVFEVMLIGLIKSRRPNLMGSV
jgi:flagellar protein FlaJ